MRDIRCIFGRHEFVRVENFASAIRDGAMRYIARQMVITEIDGMKFFSITDARCARRNCSEVTTQLVPGPDELIHFVAGGIPKLPEWWEPLSERITRPAGGRGAGISRVREGHASSAQKPRPSWGYEPQPGVTARTGHRRSTHWDGFDEMFNPALYPIEILNEKGEVIGHSAPLAGDAPPPRRGPTPDFVVVDEVARFVATPEEAEAVGRDMLRGLSVDKSIDLPDELLPATDDDGKFVADLVTEMTKPLDADLPTYPASMRHLRFPSAPPGWTAPPRKEKDS